MGGIITTDLSGFPQPSDSEGRVLDREAYEARWSSEERPWYEGRKEEIIGWLNVHPSQMDLLFWFFLSAASAYKVIHNMLVRQEIKYEKLLRGKTGHPYRAFSNWNVPDDQWPHELDLTEVCRLYPVNWVRGSEVDDRYEADAEGDFNGEIHYFEMDESTERGAKLEKRLHTYDAISNPVLWITHREDRRDNMRAKCTNENCYFGVFQEILDNPYGPVWVNKYGELASLTS